jgi:hypothetical protein
MLWGLTIFYGGIAWILEVRRRQPDRRNARGAGLLEVSFRGDV